MLTKAIRTYNNFLPLAVLTSSEAAFVHTIVAGIAALWCYWFLCIMPSSVMYIFQRLFFYITGESFLLPTTMAVLDQDLRFLTMEILKGVESIATIVHNQTNELNLNSHVNWHLNNFKTVAPAL